MQSHIPSQAQMMKSMSFVIFSIVMSGKAVIIWSSGFIIWLVLYSKSPMLLESASIPLTRLSSTNPLALSMRYFSLGVSGLWSILRSLAFPFFERTERLSPAFEQSISALVIITTFAVHPACTTSLSKPAESSPYSFEEALTIFPSSFLPSLVSII